MIEIENNNDIRGLFSLVSSLSEAELKEKNILINAFSGEKNRFFGKVIGFESNSLRHEPNIKEVSVQKIKVAVVEPYELINSENVLEAITRNNLLFSFLSIYSDGTVIKESTIR